MPLTSGLIAWRGPSVHSRKQCTLPEGLHTVHSAQWKAHSACPVLREKSWLWAIEKSEMMGGGSRGDNGPWATSANPTSSPPPTCKQITPRRQWAGCSQNMQAMDQIDRPCSSTPSFNFLHDLTNNEKGSNSMLPSTQKHIPMFLLFTTFSLIFSCFGDVLNIIMVPCLSFVFMFFPSHFLAALGSSLYTRLTDFEILNLKFCRDSDAEF